MFAARSTRSYALQRPPSSDGERTRSLFIQEALAAEGWHGDAVQRLTGAERADICVIGGGYTGLWTAIRLREADPSVQVIVLEADLCGSGASGRNSGWAGGWWLKFPTLVKLFGTQEALRLARQASQGIDEIEASCLSDGNKAQFARGGGIWTATCPAHVGAWREVMEATQTAGVDIYEPVEPAELRRRLGSDVFLAGVVDRSIGTMQPAVFARALARRAADLGVRIYERSPVLEISVGAGVSIRCEHGRVTAEEAVLAMNAWMAHLPDIRPAVFVISSDIVVTPPIPDRLKEMGFTGREHAHNSRMMINYCRTTWDGRLLFGRGASGSLAFKGRIGPAFDYSRKQADGVTCDFRTHFPGLADVPVAAAWSGPIDRSASGLPWFGKLGGNERVRYVAGYSGAGVAQAVVGGRVLASLLLGRDDEWVATAETLERVHGGKALPPEPFRYFGARLVQEAIRNKEDAEIHGRRPSWLSTQLARLVPGAEMRAVHARPARS